MQLFVYLIVLYCVNYLFLIMSVPAGGHLGDEELLKLAPMGPPNQIVTGAVGKLPDVGGKCCI